MHLREHAMIPINEDHFLVLTTLWTSYYAKMIRTSYGRELSENTLIYRYNFNYINSSTRSVQPDDQDSKMATSSTSVGQTLLNGIKKRRVL